VKLNGILERKFLWKNAHRTRSWLVLRTGVGTDSTDYSLCGAKGLPPHYHPAPTVGALQCLDAIYSVNR
jgi:hypothetical protein